VVEWQPGSTGSRGSMPHKRVGAQEMVRVKHTEQSGEGEVDSHIQTPTKGTTSLS